MRWVSHARIARGAPSKRESECLVFAVAGETSRHSFEQLCRLLSSSYHTTRVESRGLKWAANA